MTLFAFALSSVILGQPPATPPKPEPKALPNPTAYRVSLPAPTTTPLAARKDILERESAAGLAFDDFWPRLPLWGRRASGLAWSESDRYLTYLWNPYNERFYQDLYLYDKVTGTSTRLTSPPLFVKFDKTVTKAIEQRKKDDKELEESLKMNELEYREWRMLKKKEAEDRKEPLPRYDGPSPAVWSPAGEEFAFTFRGDLYRWKVGEAAPVRLSRTQDGESVVEFTPDGKQLIYQRGGALYRRDLSGGAYEDQITPKLPDGVNYGGADLAPDGRRLMVRGFKSRPAARKIDYVSYRGRFTQFRQWDRNVSDDLFGGESYLYLYDLNDALPTTPEEDKPWEVFKWPGGSKGWQEFALSENPWSRDGGKFVFGTWDRDKGEFTLAYADEDKREVKTFYKDKPNGEHTTPTMADPMFTPDGKVVALLDTSGYRHAWLLDPTVEGGAPRQITKGDYDLYPKHLSADGRTLWVTTGEAVPARQGLYTVDMASGAMTRRSPAKANVSDLAISKDGREAAYLAASWDDPTELYVAGTDKKVTVSHSEKGYAMAKKQPELFTWKNRLGMTLHGFRWLPSNLKKGERRPLFIYVYGGPLGTGKTVNEGAFGTTDYWFNRYLAEVYGYITVAVDVRGQSGYGNAIGRANYNAPGVAQTEDMVDMVDALAKTLPIDRSKVGLNGWSFGGFQTQQSMYTRPDVFTLGIAGAGPTEWQNYNNWYTQGVIGPVPNRKPEDLDKFSLTHVARNLRGPLLLLHGIEDDNVLFQDTVQVYRRLLQYGRGPLVELAIDPTGGHGMGGDMDTRDRHAIYLAFLDKWWGPFGRK